MVTRYRPLIEATKSSSFWTLGFFLCAGLLSFVRIHIPLQEPQESRYAEIPRQMLAEGSWLVPVLHGEPYMDKPPLLYWLVMGSYSLFGVHDWAARLVPCSATFLTIVLTFFWGRRVLGPRGGFLAGAILALSVRFIYLSRMVTMDSLLCLWVVATLAGAHLALPGNHFRWRFWLASAIACGLGVLTKGPVSLALVVCPIFVFSFLIPKDRRPPIWAWLTYVGLALGVAMPWYLAVTASDPAFIEYFFWRHNVERFLTPFDHQEPFWFYAPEILGGMLPWTLILPGLIWSVVRRREPSIAAPPGAAFFLFSFLWCVFFFSLSGCKRPGYILPAMPLFALALTSYLDRSLPTGALIRGLLLHRSRLAFGAVLLTLAAAGCSCFYAAYQGLAPRRLGSVFGLTFCGALLLAGWRWRNVPAMSWLLCGAAAFAGVLIGTYVILPGYARHFSMRGQVRPLARVAKDGSLPVACYPRGWDSVNFYLQRRDVKVYGLNERGCLLADLAAAPRTLLYVRTERTLRDLLSELPDGLEYEPRGRQGTVRVGFVRQRGDRLVKQGEPAAP